MRNHLPTKLITLRVPLALLANLDKLVAIHPRYNRSCTALAVLARGLEGISAEDFDVFVRQVMV